LKYYLFIYLFIYLQQLIAKDTGSKNIDTETLLTCNKSEEVLIYNDTAKFVMPST